MSRLIDFIKGLLKLAIAGGTAFFAVAGAGFMLEDYPLYAELGEDLHIGLGFVYFFFVLLMVYIGMDEWKNVTSNIKDKKK